MKCGSLEITVIDRQIWVCECAAHTHTPKSGIHPREIPMNLECHYKYQDLNGKTGKSLMAGSSTSKHKPASTSSKNVAKGSKPAAKTKSGTKAKGTNRSSSQTKSNPSRASRSASSSNKTSARKSSASRDQSNAGLSTDRKLDILGVSMALAGILTLLSLLSPVNGALTGTWVKIIGQGFGWGMYVLPIGLLVVHLEIVDSRMLLMVIRYRLLPERG